MSSSRPEMRVEIRPSWGSRRSAMSMPEMSLMRDATAGEALHGLGQAGVGHSVDAHPDREVILAGLHVDVGGARIHGLGEQVVNQLDDRRLLRHLAQLPRAVAGVEVLDGPLLAHEVEQAVDLVVYGQAEIDRFTRIEVIERGEQRMVLNVAGDAVQVLPVPPDQHRIVDEPVELDRRLGDELVHLQAVRKLLGPAEVERALLLGEAAHEEVLGDGAGAHQQGAEPAAHRLLDAQRLLDIGGRNVAALDEQFAESLPAGGPFEARLRRRFRFPMYCHSRPASTSAHPVSRTPCAAGLGDSGFRPQEDDAERRAAGSSSFPHGRESTIHSRPLNIVHQTRRRGDERAGDGAGDRRCAYHAAKAAAPCSRSDQRPARAKGESIPSCWRSSTAMSSASASSMRA